MPIFQKCGAKAPTARAGREACWSGLPTRVVPLNFSRSAYKRRNSDDLPLGGNRPANRAARSLAPRPSDGFQEVLGHPVVGMFRLHVEQDLRGGGGFAQRQ